LANVLQRLPGGRGCGILKVQPTGVLINTPAGINTAHIHTYFIEFADGTLDRWFRRSIQVSNYHGHSIDMRRTTFLNICEKIREQMVCLLDIPGNYYVYLDLKLANVLYKCNNPANLNQTKLLLGDIGSAVPSASGGYATTFPPPECLLNPDGTINFASRGVRFRTLENKEQALSWNLGILLLSFVSGQSLQYYTWPAINSNSGINLVNHQNFMIVLRNTYRSDDIANFFNFLPSARTSIRRSLLSLNYF
jgi:hypothetical protein